MLEARSTQYQTYAILGGLLFIAEVSRRERLRSVLGRSCGHIRARDDLGDRPAGASPTAVSHLATVGL